MNPFIAVDAIWHLRAISGPKIALGELIFLIMLIDPFQEIISALF